ncbi:MAG: ATP-binding protein [Actinomycetota bacterium]|nr:ATP-binding protein [Actinomycetota bacterium]
MAELLVSELATMVIRRSAQEFTVAIDQTSSGVRVTILDPSATATRPSDPTTQDAVARGLRVVAALAQRWAVEPAGDGVRMWFELALEGAPQSLDAPHSTSAPA